MPIVRMSKNVTATVGGIRLPVKGVCVNVPADVAEHLERNDLAVLVGEDARVPAENRETRVQVPQERRTPVPQQHKRRGRPPKS
jgi:hypothetical protein